METVKRNLQILRAVLSVVNRWMTKCMQMAELKSTRLSMKIASLMIKMRNKQCYRMAEETAALAFIHHLWRQQTFSPNMSLSGGYTSQECLSSQNRLAFLLTDAIDCRQSKSNKVICFMHCECLVFCHGFSELSHCFYVTPDFLCFAVVLKQASFCRWLNPLLSLGSKRTLVAEDFYGLTSDNTTEVVGDHLQR